MKCAICASSNPEGAKFCAECGAALASRCKSCGTDLPPGAKFCLECGAKAGGAAAPSMAARQAPAHLADKIRSTRDSLEGERKQVTVLFADVQGSMDLSEQMDPETWSKIMQRFFQILAEGVERFEGFVDKFTGDGIMALFGAPIAHEDHAQRACYAALHMREELARYANEIRRDHGVVFSTRIGLNSGEVVVGAIGDDMRMEYTAQGHTVGLAQRMEALADANSCFLTASTAALARGYFALDDLGEMQVKGVATPVRVHRLTGMGTSRSHFDISLSRGLSRFVGRASDVRILEDALASASAGQGQVVGIVAEAGTGKSRLCFEFVEHCRARGIKVFEAHAVAHGRNIPFLPIVELFRSCFGIARDDDDRAAREKIAGRMVLLDRAFADSLPVVFDFLEVSDASRPTVRLEGEARQRQLLSILRQLLLSLSKDEPTVTLIEDLHWLDAASADFLAQLVELSSGNRNLFLLNFRPEFRAEWMAKSWYRQIALAPLGREAIAEVLADLLGTDPSLVSLTDLIFARTAGNPFFTEEVAQSLIESGALAGSRGKYRLVTPVERLEVPATVHALLAARIDRLPEREKRLLQSAAVIGKTFDEPLLATVADLPPTDLAAALAGLRRAEFIYEQTLYPTAEYSFKHPVTQEVALGSQLRERRRQTHTMVAQAIERRDADRLDERAALLAHHWEEAGEALISARWHKRAAERVQLTEINAAAHHWNRVKTLLHDTPETPETMTIGIAASLQLLNTAWRLGSGMDKARALLTEGQDLAVRLGDHRSYLKLALIYSHAAYFNSGDTQEYLRHATENRNAALQTSDVALQANAWWYFVNALAATRKTREALQAAEEGLARFPRDLPPSEWSGNLNPYTIFSWFRCDCLNRMGRLAEGQLEFERCQRLALEDGTPQPGGLLLAYAAETAYRTNDPERALANACKLEEISARMGHPLNMVSAARTAFLSAHLAAGRYSDVVEKAPRNSRGQDRAMPPTCLSEALLGLGQLSEAIAAAESAIAIARPTLEGYFEAIAQGVVARALMRRDGVPARKKIDEALENAATLIERTASYLLAPALLEWRAEFAALLGDREKQRELLEKAERDYAVMGAPLQVARLAAIRAKAIKR
jgi:class 3 adenylate cyclase